MGERKAVNKYYPPDWDPSKGGLDKYHGQHPLRERASKLHLGILVIRFEMPFNIWCGGCNNHIGMGVRYNAEKKKIGMYYTTPIWQFRMKCHLCDNYIEMHTDPQNFDYIVASGGRRKEERYDQNDAECAAAHEPEERKKLGTDPMFKLQYQTKDEAVVEEAEPIIDKLQVKQEVWKDDYLLNRSLRKRHRNDRKSDKAADSVLKKKMGLDLKMLPTSKNDKMTSSLVRFTTEKDGMKLDKKSVISSIFTDKRTRLLTTLKQSGVRCSRYPDKDNLINTSSLVKVHGKRKRSAESSSSSTSSGTSSLGTSSSGASSSEVSQPSKTLYRRHSEPSATAGVSAEFGDVLEQLQSGSGTRLPTSSNLVETPPNDQSCEGSNTLLNSEQGNVRKSEASNVVTSSLSLVSGYSSSDSG